MSYAINIHIANDQVATLILEETTGSLMARGARRTPNGFILGIPARLRFRAQGNAQGIAHVRHIRVHLQLEDGFGTEFGIGTDDSIYAGTISGNECSTNVEMRGTYEALEALEGYRQGQPPKFTARAWVEAFYAVEVPGLGLKIQSKPEICYGDTQVNYPRDGWNHILDLVGRRNVLVEIPKSNTLGAEWNEIYKFLSEGSRAYDRGGNDGWKACVVACREGLAKWRGLEQTTFGPGWKAPSREENEEWSGAQRMNALRYWLLQVAHLGPHTVEDIWTREDALLVLATLSTLLNARSR